METDCRPGGGHSGSYCREDCVSHVQNKGSRSGLTLLTGANIRDEFGGNVRGGEGLDDYVLFHTRGDTADAKVEELGAVVEKLAVGEAGGSISNCSERVP